MGAPIKWENADFIWDGAPMNKNLDRYTWDDVSFVEDTLKNLENQGAGGDVNNIFQKEPDKKKRLIKLICKIQGKTTKQTKEITDYKIKVSDIQLLAKKVLNIEVLTEDIKF